MTNTYDRGDDIRLTATFRKAPVAPATVGDLQQPTAAVILVKKPDDTWAGYKSDSADWSDQGNWDAEANTPALVNGAGTAADYYTSTTVGTVDFGDGDITFAVDDQVFYNGDIWHKIPTPSAIETTNPSAGIEYIDQSVAQAGTWYYRSEGAGTGQAGAENDFRVRASRF
jgi:hypothetical protein